MIQLKMYSQKRRRKKEIDLRKNELEINHQVEIKKQETKFKEEQDHKKKAGLIVDDRPIEKKPGSNGIMDPEDFYKKNSD
ncbi:hypothetical protein KDV52_18715 [Providencia rettgeri]